MEVSKYILLVHRKLRGEIGKQEQKELGDWLERESPDGFAEGLERAWELSRRYKKNYEPDVEAGLARLQARMAASSKAESNKPGPRALLRPSLSWLSVAAAVGILLVVGWWWSGKGRMFYATGADEMEEIALPDGSTVLLNENSSLKVYPGFQEDAERRVELSGEAYFDIQPDASRPFLITTGDAVVEVLGTAFNLRSYPAEGFTEVEVEEGKVRLSEAGKENAIQLSPGQRGVCRPGKAMKAKDSPGLNAHSWRTHRLQFRDTPLNEALAALERYFNVKLQLSRPEIADCGITMEFEDFTLSEVLQAFELIFKVQARKVGDSYLLEGGSCEPASSGR